MQCLAAALACVDTFINLQCRLHNEINNVYWIYTKSVDCHGVDGVDGISVIPIL